MTHCLNLQICFNSIEELEQQMKEVLSRIKEEPIDNRQIYQSDNFQYDLMRLFNTCVSEYDAKLELGHYYKTLCIDDEFFSLSYTEMLQQLDKYLDKTDCLYSRINFLLNKICKLQS